MMVQANVDRDWDARYRSGETPWDSALVSRELRIVLDERPIVPGRAIELGCGTGTNAVFLAQQGFQVTAVDCSAPALEQAAEKAQQAGVSVDWIEADVQHFGDHLQPFDFVFDRGCYHCCRRTDLPGILTTLANITHPGSLFLCLAGNANEQTEHGPPRVTEQEIRDELGRLFDVEFIREFRFQDAGEVEGPLGWSCLLVRKSD
ncbi:MAG: class I SAM-dependent methyltransferase [Planctomycetota bacterium]|nr:MAG: class I SAM-dependent methyltransferase [Planctomycetota bacterium]